ncbi:MAG: class I SAM-dependent rRNA methyltransferase [Deltaproteobacteria bacterium]|nr:class I SAM-dependent rRNA methyltransferase [Deltaproteobacteria bacterium]
MNIASVFLKKGKEGPILHGSPWVYSGSVEKIEDYKEPGQMCDIFSYKNKFVARGYVNTKSQITCRVLAHRAIELDRNFLKEKIETAFNLRKQFVIPFTNAYRLIHSEGDFLPGLIVDVYNKGIVCQFLTAGMESFKQDVVSILRELFKPDFIYEKSDTSAMAKEGLKSIRQNLYGDVKSEIMIQEYGHTFSINPQSGQKTGFFLDQRDSRYLLGEISRNKRVCDCFSYTGGFSVYAGAGGAKSIVSVDESVHVFSIAEKNISLNNINTARFIQKDVFRFLRETDSQYDIIVLDPPPFARSKSSVKEALTGYKELNIQAIKKLSPGGILFSFSCSQAISTELFQQILFNSAIEARKEIQILRRIGQPVDHPVNIYHREGEYLKGFILKVIGGM